MKFRIFSGFLASALIFTSALPAHSYLRVGGIAGDSKDIVHRNWFEIISFNQDHNRWTHKDGAFSFLPKESQSLEGGTATVVRYAKNPIPDLHTLCVTGAYIGSVTLDIPANKDKEDQFLKLEMSDVVITDVHVKRPNHPKTLPLEHITMNFKHATWEVP